MRPAEGWPAEAGRSGARPWDLPHDPTLPPALSRCARARSRTRPHRPRAEASGGWLRASTRSSRAGDVGRSAGPRRTAAGAAARASRTNGARCRARLFRAGNCGLISASTAAATGGMVRHIARLLRDRSPASARPAADAPGPQPARPRRGPPVSSWRARSMMLYQGLSVFLRAGAYNQHAARSCSAGSNHVDAAKAAPASVQRDGRRVPIGIASRRGIAPSIFAPGGSTLAPSAPDEPIRSGKWRMRRSAHHLGHRPDLHHRRRTSPQRGRRSGRSRPCRG